MPIFKKKVEQQEEEERKNNEDEYKVLHKKTIKEIESIDVSISHCKEYAVASVVVLFN